VCHHARPHAHEVVGLTSRREALGRIEAGERFDLIFCDLLMPELSGMGFHAAVMGRTPELAGRIVFMTGGAFTPEARAFRQSVPHARLEKPFDLGEVLTLLDEHLAHAPSR
jgi:CheY-like chemotaxis protein